MDWFFHNFQHQSSKLFPDAIRHIPNSWVSSSYLPTLTFLQVLIAAILIGKDIENPRTARIFRFMGVSALLLLSDAKFAYLRLETLGMPDYPKNDLPGSPGRHFPLYRHDENFNFDTENNSECYPFEYCLLEDEDEDEDQDDEG